MREAEEIALNVLVEENKIFMQKFNKFLKKEGIRLGFHEELTLICNLIARNNKRRTVDKAILSFIKMSVLPKSMTTEQSK